LVEILTLSKMAAHVSTSSVVDLKDLSNALERGYLNDSEALRLRVSYALQGHALSPHSRIHLLHAGRFECTTCGKPVKKLFDGYCYPCLQNSAQADRCVLNPVGCHYMQGTCREPAWGESFCYQKHYLYLSFTDKFKVGITRQHQIPTRWIDQGATMAVLLADVGSRHQAGVLEAFLTQKFADKSHWLKMLRTGNDRPTHQEFNAVRLQALEMLTAGLKEKESGGLKIAIPQNSPTADSINLLLEARTVEIEFPLWSEMPEKISSINLDKLPEVKSAVHGVKGQYLFLENGVFNVRRHEGYVVDFECLSSNGRDGEE